MKLFLRRHRVIIALITLFVGLNTIAICNWYTYQLNPDGMSYITIAEKYAHGDLRHALNGYWSPMMSWLLVPWVWVGANMIIAGKLVSLGAAAAILGIMYAAFRRYQVSKAITYGLSFFMAVLLSEWVIYNPITPDMVMAVWVLLLGLALSAFVHKPTRRAGIVLGVLGALMFLTKGVGFYLFLGIIGLTGAWQWWYREQRQYRPLLPRYAPALIAFFAITLPFIGLMSIKYHKLTINNAGTFNWNVYGINTRGAQPIDNHGPYVPPNDTALSAWEDPTALANRSPEWSVIDSKHSLGYFLKNIVWVNFNAVFSIVRGFGAYVAFAFVVLIVGCWQRKWHQREYALFTLINGIMIVGYSLLFIDSRYLWGGVALAVVSSGLFLSQLERKKLVSTAQLALGAVLIGGSLLLTVSQAIVGSRDVGEDLYHVSQVVKPVVPKGAHVMSDRFAPAFPVCYHLELKCYNVLDPSTDHADDYYQLIKKQKVAYYLDFHMREGDPALKNFVGRYASVVEDKVIDGTRITIYRIN